MKFFHLDTTLKLAYPPMTVYEFEFLKEEKVVREILDNAGIYFVCQRKRLWFCRFEKTGDQTIEIGIKEDGGSETLRLSFDVVNFIEKNFGESEGIEVRLSTVFKDQNVGAVDPQWDGIRFYKKEKFLYWLSPSKAIYEHYHGLLDSTVVAGDVNGLNTFKVLYVGKSTDQEIYSRLSGHEKIQKILATEVPISGHNQFEIYLNLFKISLMNQSEIVALNVTTEEMDKIDGKFEFADKIKAEESDVFKDAEKAFVKILNPRHNEIKFKNYPKSKDGLHAKRINSFSYAIKEDISFEWGDKTIGFKFSDPDFNRILILNSADPYLE